MNERLLWVVDSLLPKGDNYSRLVHTFLVQGKNLEAERLQSSKAGFAAGHLGDALISAVEDMAERKFQEHLFCWKIRLQRPVGEARLHRNLPHGGTFNAVPGNNAPRSIQQFQATLIMINDFRHAAPSGKRFSSPLEIHLTSHYPSGRRLITNSDSTLLMQNVQVRLGLLGLPNGPHNAPGDLIDLTDAVNPGQDATFGILGHYALSLLVIEAQAVADN